VTDAWRVARLGDVCNFDKVQGIHADLPYVGLENIESGTGRFLGATDAASVKSATFRFSPEHVLYGRLRPYLNKVLLPDFEGHCSTEIFPVKPSPEVSREYLFHWLSMDATVKSIDATSTGARMPRANMNAVLELELPVPPLPEQRRIVAILEEAFECIATAKANAEKNRRNSKELFASQREALLSSGGDTWNEALLSDLCEIRHGYAFEGEFFASDGDYVLLTPGNFFESGGYRDRGGKQKYFIGSIPNEYVLSEDSLLVAMTEQAAGLLGSPLLVPEPNRFLHNQRLGLVVGKPGAVLVTDFFFHVFNLTRVRAEIHASASGVKVRHTSPSKLGAVRVAFPSTSEAQRQIASRLQELTTECDQLVSVYEKKLAALDDLKKSLLHQAFTGQLTSAKQTIIASRPALQTTTPEFAANVIALAHARHERQKREKTFGHVKEQKVLHLVEAIAKIDLGRQPMKDAAGPNDFKHMLKAEEWAKDHGFFEMVKRGEGYEFRKLSAFDERISTARQVLGPCLPQLERVIDFLVPMDTEEAEVLATVHAAWNNLLIDGAELTDGAIVSAAREGWHADKLKIPEHKFRSAIELIRQKGLVPDGTAKYVGGQQPLL
jgi:type I restriction enzyme S subunit